MIIILKNKHTLKIDDFELKCSIGRNGITKNKIEGDKKTPRGIFELGPLFYRHDKLDKPLTKLKNLIIKKNMGWCDDVKSKKNYNKLVNIKKKIHHEKLYRKDNKYDLLLLIKYNYKKPLIGKGSCIFLHLTNDYKPTAGCIALRKKDFLIMLKLLNKKSKIKIV